LRVGRRRPWGSGGGPAEETVAERDERGAEAGAERLARHQRRHEGAARRDLAGVGQPFVRKQREDVLGHLHDGPPFAAMMGRARSSGKSIVFMQIIN
jgi:hypothetical protein